MQASWRRPSEQGHFYQVRTKAADASYIGPDEWLKSGATDVEGSWWPEWTRVAGRAIRRAM